MKESWQHKFRRSPKEKRTAPDGTVFDSAAELKRWRDLEVLAVAKQIRNLRRQVKYDLILPDGTPIKTGDRIARYTADFVYEARSTTSDPCLSWNTVIEDYKGYMSRDAKFRIAVFEACYKVKVKITN